MDGSGQLRHAVTKRSEGPPELVNYSVNVYFSVHILTELILRLIIDRVLMWLLSTDRCIIQK